ncbi:MAG: asparaginase domain-containing protein [Opitutaceae bacterium]
MRIHIITTGGTIDKVYFDRLSEYQIGEPQIAEVLREARVALEWEVEPVLRKDSLELTDDDRALIRSRVAASPHARILVTHGTDTMCETGRALAGIDGKTIVLTGSLAPARFKSSDAVFNIGFALACVQTLAPGVYLAMNGRVFDPARTRKNREANAFEEIPG